MTNHERTRILEELLADAPCTCVEPNGIGLVGHDDDNPPCYLNRATTALQTPAHETAVHATPAQPEKAPPCPPRQPC